MTSVRGGRRSIPTLALGLAVVVVGLGVGLVLAGCSSSPTASPSDGQHNSATSSSSPSSATSSIPPSPAGNASTEVSVRVEKCSSTFGAATSTTSLPASVTVTVPGDLVNSGSTGLAAYSDPAGRMTLLGPSGWRCRGIYGADGDGGLLVSPQGQPVPSDPFAGWHFGASSSDQAIVGFQTGASPVQGAALACPLFASAANATSQGLGQGCGSAHPERESVAAAPSPMQASFEDPPGVAGDGMPSGGQNPADAVMLYLPKAGESTAYLATCTLPAAQHNVCTAVLNYFTTLYG